MMQQLRMSFKSNGVDCDKSRGAQHQKLNDDVSRLLPSRRKIVKGSWAYHSAGPSKIKTEPERWKQFEKYTVKEGDSKASYAKTREISRDNSYANGKN